MNKRLIIGVMLLGCVSVFAAAAQNSTDPAAACVLTPNQGFANIRNAPNITADVIGSVESGTTARGRVVTTDNAGARWYWVAEGWVAQSAVAIDPACADLFVITPLTQAPRDAVTILFQTGVSEGAADDYTDQVAIFGNSPRVPAVVIDAISIGAENDADACSERECGAFTLFLFTPLPSRSTGLFPAPITPSAPRTPVPGDSSLLDALEGYTAPLDCLPLGQVCLVALLRAPADADESCPADVFSARLEIPDDTPRASFFQPVTEVLREAALQSLDGARIVTAFNQPFGADDPCQLELLLPVSEPGEERFRLVEGGLQANFDIIRVTPPDAASE